MPFQTKKKSVYITHSDSNGNYYFTHLPEDTYSVFLQSRDNDFRYFHSQAFGVPGPKYQRLNSTLMAPTQTRLAISGFENNDSGYIN